MSTDINTQPVRENRPPLNLMTRSSTESLVKKIVGETTEPIKWILIAIVAVLLVTLGGIVQSYLANKAATYQNLTDKINEQSYKIDNLQKDIEKANQLKALQISTSSQNN